MKRFIKLSIAAAAVVVSAGSISFATPVSADRGNTFPSCGSVRGSSQVGVANTDIVSSSKYYSTKGQGNADSCVKNIQTNLNLGFCSPSTRLSTDGIYGAKTAQAVRNYQNYYRSQRLVINTGSGFKSIYVDGIVGPQTWSLLNSQYIYRNPVFSCR